jgi:cardiolipin synthase (CMP-forming)
VAGAPVGDEAPRADASTQRSVRESRAAAREEATRAREALGPRPGPGAPVAERAAHARERTRLTFYRLMGLDRSGPPPEQTGYNQPWRVWTIPNAIGIVRAILIPIFLVTAFASDHGTDALPAVLFAVCAWGDYADGITARITGQYSRFGALMDPIIDRCLVLSGVVVVWAFDLLPRWALALLVLRELYVLFNGRRAIRLKLELKINWPGRIAVGPTMSALFFAMCGLRTFAELLLYLGLALAYYAAYLYRREARHQLASRPAPSSRA